MHHLNLNYLETLASQTAADNGYDLCGIKLLTNLKPITMQLHIRRCGGDDVSIDDCALLTKPMEEAITASKLLKDDYVLEISSPGIKEFLTTEKEFNSFKGFPVEVIFRQPDKPSSNLTGLLKEKGPDSLILNIKGKNKLIPIEDLISVRLVSPSG